MEVDDLRGYAIPAAEQELGRPFMVGHDCGWSATVRHVQPWSAMVGHAGWPWSVMISHGRSRSAKAGNGRSWSAVVGHCQFKRHDSSYHSLLSELHQCH